MRRPARTRDGYVTGPNDRVGAGLGDGGERLHHWAFGGPWTYGAERGAWLVGRTMHDLAEEWGGDPASACRSSSSPSARTRRR
jgi:hypothetical protein